LAGREVVWIGATGGGRAGEVILSGLLASLLFGDPRVDGVAEALVSLAYAGVVCAVATAAGGFGGVKWEG
jgi:hypothetical protein